MTFISLRFAALVVTTLVGYFLLPLRRRWTVLLAASVVFCWWGGVATPLFALASCTTAFLGARVTSSLPKQSAARRRAVTCLAALLIGILALVKILPAVVSGQFDLYMPLGVSYYTFSLVGYVVDVYRGRTPADESFFSLLLFTLFFPKFLMGPISKHQQLSPQLNEGHRFSFDRACRGGQLALWGLFKKLVIADRIALLGGTELLAHDLSGALTLLLFCLSAIQLYCDFSGCIDIATGISEAFGIELEPNFDRPFFSRTVPEFWRRWHMSLGAWFREYVYMPVASSPRTIRLAGLARSRFGRGVARNVPALVALPVTWLLTGLWHGTGMDYIVWGCYWGALVCLSTLFSKRVARISAALRIDTDAGDWVVFQRLRTFSLFVLGRIITMPGNLATSASAAKRILMGFAWIDYLDGPLVTMGLPPEEAGILCLALLALVLIETLQGKASIRDRVAGWNMVPRCAFWALAVVATLLLGVGGSSYVGGSQPFAYAFF